jgi:hypothetical protein
MLNKGVIRARLVVREEGRVSEYREYVARVARERVEGGKNAGKGQRATVNNRIADHTQC